jgi:2-oxoisovalerate dehydrogenase E1 component
MEKHIIDGNNILEVVSKFGNILNDVRKNPHPVFVEFKTFRRRGHEESSGVKYVPKELIQEWEKRDPISNFENYLLEKEILSQNDISKIKKKIRDDINSSWKLAEAESFPKFDAKKELADVYADFNFEEIKPTLENKTNIRLVDAISVGLRQAMRKYSDLVIMGQDIAEYGGVFKVTDGFVAEFGKSRVRNTPICESIILSTALGLSVKGIKSVVEMQFADFSSSGFTAIVNNLAKTHYRWGKNVDVVVRMPTGAGVQAGPFHSQSNEAWFAHTPGLKVVYPAFPNDAKGLLLASIEDPNPVMFFEHKALYRSVYGNVSEEYFTLEIGKANVLKQGNDVTIISYGMGVHWCLDLLEKHKDKSVELIDLRTLVPMDKETIKKSIIKTGKVLIVQEDIRLGGIASDLSSWIVEECFELLDAPVRIVSSLDTPVPFNKNLEDGFLGKSRVEDVFLELFEW